MELLELLRAENVEGFNTAREDSARLDLFAAELDGLTLVGVDLSGAVLSKSDLTGTDLSEATLHGASLDEIDGGELKLVEAHGIRLKLRGAWLEDADLTDAEFPQVDLNGATLTNAKAGGAILTSAKMHDLEANGAHFVGADLTEANLKGASLVGADLSRARLVEARLSGADLTDALLEGAELEGARLDGATLIGARLQAARLARATLVEADLSGAKLAHADLSSCNLTRAKLAGADLTGAVLVDACLDGADLTGAVLAGADLSGSDPVALGLDDAQTASLAASGARFDAAAPVVFDRASVALSGAAMGVAWRNPDTAESPTLRWAVRTAEGKTTTGVLPVSATSVHAHDLLGTKSGFQLMLLIERADGFIFQACPLGADGRAGRTTIYKLGADPLAPATWRVLDGAVWGWLLTRDGPSLRVFRDKLDGGGLVEVRKEARPQVMGMLSGTTPMLLGKGGVALSLMPEGAGPPRRLPDGFPPDVGTTVAVGDGLVGVAYVPPTPRKEGRIDVQRVGPRGASEPELLADAEGVTSIDVVADDDGVHVVWTTTNEGERDRVGWTRWPGTELQEVSAGPAGLAGARWLLDPSHPDPRLLVAGKDGRLVAVDLDGEVVAHIDTKSVAAATRGD